MTMNCRLGRCSNNYDNGLSSWSSSSLSSLSSSSSSSCSSAWRKLLYYPLLLLLVLLPIKEVEGIFFDSAILTTLTQNGLSLLQLRNILGTEIDKEMSDYDEVISAVIWRRATWLEWERLMNLSDDGSYEFPVAYCHSGVNKNGEERINEMKELLLEINATAETHIDTEANESSETYVIYNDFEMTCVLTRLPVNLCMDAAMSGKSWLVVQPVLQMMKLTEGSVDRLEEYYGEKADEDEDEDDDDDDDDDDDEAEGSNVKEEEERDNNVVDEENLDDGGMESNATSTSTSPPSTPNGYENVKKDQINENTSEYITNPKNFENITKTILPPKINLLLCQGVLSEEDLEQIDEDIAEYQAREIKLFLKDKTTDGNYKVWNLFFQGGIHGATGDHTTDTQNNVARDAHGDGNYGSTQENGDEEAGDAGDSSAPSSSSSSSTSTTASSAYTAAATLSLQEAKKGSRREFWAWVFNQSMKNEDNVGLCDALIDGMNVTYNNRSMVLTLELPMRVDDTLSDKYTQLIVRKLRLFCGWSLLAGLTMIDEVCAVEVESRVKKSNVHSANLMQGGIQNQNPFYEVGLDGKDQIIAVADTGIDVNNCYFWDSNGDLPLDGTVDLSRRKVVQYIPFVDKVDQTYGHGTHVAGTIAGQKASDGKNPSASALANGVAYSAKLAFTDIGHPDGTLSVPVPADDLLQAGYNVGAKIHSASWGSETNQYGFNARNFDEFMYDNDHFLVLVAAGNSGRGNTFFTVGDPATAKNIIAVGASQSTGPDLSFGMLGPNYIADFSSRGTSADGRTLPHVVAPGHFILSAGALPNDVGECDPLFYPPAGTFSEGVLSISGTSMATPAVSGIAAIIRQYFEQGWYPTGEKDNTRTYFRDPSGAAIKAIILNGAQPMIGVDNGNSGVYPTKPYDDISNFGRVSLTDSLYLPGKTNYDLTLWDREGVRNDEERVYNVTIDKSKGCSGTQISVTLVWTDPPASVGCRRCLVNDLDLTLTKKGSNVLYYPNGLNQPDNINNAERVQLQANDGDVFYIKVRGANLITRGQNFALAATGCFGGVANTLQGESAFNQDHTKEKWKMIVGIVGGVVGVAVLTGCVFGLVRRFCTASS